VCSDLIRCVLLQCIGDIVMVIFVGKLDVQRTSLGEGC